MNKCMNSVWLWKYYHIFTKWMLRVPTCCLCYIGSMQTISWGIHKVNYCRRSETGGVDKQLCAECQHCGKTLFAPFDKISSIICVIVRWPSTGDWKKGEALFRAKRCRESVKTHNHSLKGCLHMAGHQIIQVSLNSSCLQQRERWAASFVRNWCLSLLVSSSLLLPFSFCAMCFGL